MDNEILRYFYMYNMFCVNCNYCFFVFWYLYRVNGKLNGGFLNMKFNVYFILCISILLFVRVLEGYIIKFLMNFYNVLEVCIVGCYLEGLEK